MVYPAPISFKAYKELALERVKLEVESYAWGFSTIPILAIWFPVTKSGFSESFSILEYTKTLVAPNSL